MRFLAAPLDQAEAGAREIQTLAAWPAMLQWCTRCKVLPALAKRLQLCSYLLPPSLAAELQRGAALQFVGTARCLQEGLQALVLLQAEGINAAAFKGCAVIAQLYVGPQDRMLQDVDILIQEVDLHRALGLLKSHGYRSEISPDSLSDYLSFVRNSPGAAGNQAMSLISRSGHAIDLHWKLGSFDTSILLETAQRVRVLNAEVHLVRPAFGMLLSVHHALRNDFVPDEIARDVLDCGRWFALMESNAEEMVFALDHARRCGLEAGLGAMSQIVGSLGGANPFHSLAAKGNSQGLAGLYFYQLSHGSLSTDLVYLVSPFALAQIFKGMFSGWRRYLVLMKRFEAVNGEESLSLSQRLRRLATAAVTTAPAQWRQVRALAFAKNQLR